MTTQNGTAPTIHPIDERAILLEEIAEWQAHRYRTEVRARVATRIGDPPERLEAIRQELERCEKALDALTEELVAIDRAPHQKA